MGGIFSGDSNPVSQVANVATGGVAGSVEGLAQGDYEKVFRSRASAGLSETGIGKNAAKMRDKVVNGVKGALSGVGPIGASQVDRKDLMISGPKMPNGTVLPQVGIPQAGDLQRAQINFNQQQQYNPQAMQAQNQLMQQLALQSQGQGPSLAGMQMQKGMEANLAATMAQLASQRGAANPLMQRATMQTSADIQAKTAQDAAMARLQEQLAAQGLLGQVSGTAAQQGLQQRGQDIGLATNQAGLDQQGNLAMFGAQNQAALANAGFQQGYNGLLQGYAGMDQQAKMASASNLLQNAGLGQSANMFNANLENAAKQRQTQMMGSVLSGVSQIGAAYAAPGATAAAAAAPAAAQPVNQVPAAEMGPPVPAGVASYENGYPAAQYGPPQPTPGYDPTATGSVDTYSTNPTFYDQINPRYNYSDERLKTNIEDGSKDLESFYKNLGAKKYTYKDSKHGDGTYVSPMAQDLLKHPIGKSMVVKGKDGLMVDYSRAAGTIMSAQSLILKRLAELEKKAKK